MEGIFQSIVKLVIGIVDSILGLKKIGGSQQSIGPFGLSSSPPVQKLQTCQI